jgi:CubicO group peptidase (beta-lactamase class C family)
VGEVLAPLGPHLEAAVAAFVHDRGVASVAAAAVARGERPWTFAYGVADVEDGRPARPSTPYRVGSLTKPFTAATVVRLRDAGALALDDPVTRHLPSFAGVRPPAGEPADATVADLIAHRAGLPAEAPALDEGAGAYPTVDEVLASLDGLRLVHPPGTAVRYSNLGYQLLGAIAARASGATYEACCARSVLRPLGLSRTDFAAPEGAARGHRRKAFSDLLRHAPDRRKRTNADGGLWSTVEDQATWLRAQLGDGPPWVATLAAMHPTADGAGLGWFRERIGARTVVYHQGSTPGFAARIVFSPERGAGVVAVANAETRLAALTASLVDLVLDAVEGGAPREPAPPPPPRPAAPPPASPEREELLGAYVWPGSDLLMRVEERAGALRLVELDGDGDAVSTLEPAGPDAFVAVDGGWAGEAVRVIRRPDGAVRGLRLGPWTVARLVEA